MDGLTPACLHLFPKATQGVLRSLVAVVDHLVRTALAKGHIQSVCDQFASQVVGHGPADDAATEGVYDHREVEEARMGRHIGDIGYPECVPFLCSDVPVDQVRSLPAFFGSPGSAHGSAA